MLRLALACVLFAAVACDRTHAAHEGRAEAQPSVTPSSSNAREVTPPAAPARSPASAPPSASAAAPATPESAIAALSPAEAEKLSLMRALCPVAIRTSGSQSAVGCRACFTSGTTPPDGRVVLNPTEMYAAGEVIRGSFTAPGRKEAAVSMDGCEPHSENWGGLLIVDTAPSAPRVVAYFSGVHPDHCEPYRRSDGRDVLVCIRRDGHQGVRHAAAFSFDAARATPADPSSGWEQLVDMTDDTLSACFSSDAAMSVHHGDIVGLSFPDGADGKGKSLVVEVTHAEGRPGPKFAEYCKAMTAERAPGAAAPPTPSDLVGPQKRQALTFTYDGKRFTPRPP